MPIAFTPQTNKASYCGDSWNTDIYKEQHLFLDWICKYKAVVQTFFLGLKDVFGVGVDYNRPEGHGTKDTPGCLSKKPLKQCTIHPRNDQGLVG